MVHYPCTKARLIHWETDILFKSSQTVKAINIIKTCTFSLTCTAMIGPSLIPIVNYMGSEMIVMPLIIMGILLIFGGLASFFLPETKNKSLPQTIYDSDSVPLVNPFSIFTSKRRRATKENVQICDVCKLETRNANQCNSF